MLAAIVLLAVALRVHHLGYKSLWLDEVTYVRSAQLGPLFGPYGYASISHPPGYLFLMRLASALNPAEWFLRLPAMLSGVAAVVALWALGRKLLGRTVGLLAAFLLSLSPLHLAYSQEAHSYGLFALLSTLMLLMLALAASREVAPEPPTGRRRLGLLAPWLGFIAAATLALYVHYYAIAPVGLSLLVFPCFLLAASPKPVASLWREPSQRRALLHLAGALAIVALLFAPQVVSQLSGSAATAAARAGAIESGSLEREFALSPATLGDTLLALITNRSPWYLDPLFVSATVAFWLVGLAWILWTRRALGVAFLLWMLLPLPLLAWFAFQTGFSFAPRRVIFILPVFLLTVAAGMAALARLAGWLVRWAAPARGRLAGVAVAATLTLFVLAFVKGSLDPIDHYYRSPKQDWRTLAQILQNAPGPLDAVAILPSAEAPLAWYYQSSAARVLQDDLPAALDALCAANNALYVAASTTGRQPVAAEQAYLDANFIQIPLKDLALYYRNCDPVAWYGAGAETLFPQALHADLDFPPTRRAQQQFNQLAAQAALAAAAAPAPAQPDRSGAGRQSPAQPDVAGSAAPQPAPAPSAATPAPPEQARDADTLLAELLAAAPQEAMTQARLGALALQQGQSPAAAGAFFQRAIDLDPAAWLAYSLWANSLGSSGQITQAVQLVEQGLQVLPGNLALQTMLARWQGAASPAGSDETYQAALEATRSALRERNWEEAIAAAQEAIALAPSRHEGQLLLGDAHRGSGELVQALQAYRGAAELAPWLGVLHGRQAEMLARLGQVDEAIAASLLALAIDQERWENWYALGRAYLIDALATDPGLATPGAAAAAQRAELFLLRAQALAPDENQAPARSLAELQAARPQPTPSAPAEPTPEPTAEFASMNNQQRAAARAQADEALQAGRSGEALAVYQQLVAADSQDRASRMGFANALAALGRSDEALDEFEAISADWPDFPFARIRQGALLEESGDTEAALAAYREAVRAAPGNADTHFTLAYALRRAGQQDEAIAAFEAGLALDPGRSAAQQALDDLKAGNP